MYKGPYADLIIGGEENFIPFDEDLKQGLEELKKNIQSPAQLPSFIPTNPMEHKKRYQALCRAVDDLAQINIGRQILLQINPRAKILSLEPLHEGPFDGVAAISWGSIQTLIIPPATLFDRPYYETMESLGHELMHLAHFYLEQDVLREVEISGVKTVLNPYDKFALRLLNESGAYLVGQQVGYCFLPQIKEILEKKKNLEFSLSPVFRDTRYWEDAYEEAIDHIVQEYTSDNKRPLQNFNYASLEHTKAFYAVKRAYLDLHPDLKSSQISQHIHKGYRHLINELKNIDSSQNNTKKLTKICKNGNAQFIQRLAKEAQNIKV